MGFRKPAGWWQFSETPELWPRPTKPAPAGTAPVRAIAAPVRGAGWKNRRRTTAGWRRSGSPVRRTFYLLQQVADVRIVQPRAKPQGLAAHDEGFERRRFPGRVKGAPQTFIHRFLEALAGFSHPLPELLGDIVI